MDQLHYNIGFFCYKLFNLTGIAGSYLIMPASPSQSYAKAKHKNNKKLTPYGASFQTHISFYYSIYLFPAVGSIPNDAAIIGFIGVAFRIEAQHHRVFVQLQGLFQIT